MTVHERVLANQAMLERQLADWGFSGAVSDQLISHASHVLTLRGAPSESVVKALKITSDEEIAECLRSRPDGVKPLIWMREHLPQVAPRYDELMSIELGFPYVSQPFNSLLLHPLLNNKDTLSQVEMELNRWDVLPMQVNGGTMLLLFADLDKMLRFLSLGRHEKRQSKLFSVLAEQANCKPEECILPFSLADNSVHLFYMQRLSEVSEGKSSISESLQVIYQHDGENSPVAANLVRLLNEAIARGINDIAMAPDRNTGAVRIFFRRNQRLRFSGITVSGSDKDELTRLLMARSGANKDGGRLMAPADGNATFIGKSGQAFLRLSFIPLESSSGEAISVSIRVLPRTARTIQMDDLGILPELQVELRRYMRRRYGLIVVCGPTGSGKSTTIGGMLCAHTELYGDSQKRMSVEDPCERMLPGVMHIDVSQHIYRNEKEEEVNKFAMSLRAILRHDPDVIFVGEVRDREGCMVSVDSANTGHLVLTTTHANDPVLGYRRLASFLNEDRRFDLVNVLEAILAQRLVTTVCPKCSLDHPLGPVEMDDLSHYCRSKGMEMPTDLPSTYRKANPSGCSACIDGYDGMTPVHGLLTMNPSVRELLLSKDERDWMLAQGASDSKFTLFGAAMDLFKKGKIDLDTVML